MNQKQREYLSGAIAEQHKKEKEELDKRRPDAPILNNYLVAAILDGSFKMKDQQTIRKAIHDRVLLLGKDESLLETEDYRFGRRRGDTEERDLVKLPADVLFELPGEYAEALKKYESEIEKWREERDALEAAFSAMKIKVQLGSDEALSHLIDQADKLCSMSLTASSKLMLTGAGGSGTAPKQLRR